MKVADSGSSSHFVKRLLQNSSINTLAMVIKIVIAFVMTPVILKALGTYDYGLLEVVGALVGYMGLLDAGLRPAIIRFVAKYEALKDNESLKKIFSTSLLFSTVIAIFSICLIILWGFYLSGDILAINGEDKKYLHYLLLVSVQVLLFFITQVFICFHAGHQRYYLYTSIDLIITVFYSFIVYRYLNNGYGLLFLTSASIVSSFVKCSSYYFLLNKKNYGGYAFKFNNLSISSLKELLSFGLKSFSVGTVVTISSSASVVIIGYLLGPSVVPLYSIPKRLFTHVSDISSSISNVFMPMFSNKSALKEHDSIVLTYLISTKYILTVIYPGFLFIIIFGVDFLELWVGPEISNKSSIIIRFLFLGFMLNLINPLFNQLLTAVDRLKNLFYTRLLSSSLLLIFTLIFVYFYHIEGAAFAFFMSVILSKPYELIITFRELKIDSLSFLKTVVLPVLLMGSFFVFLLIAGKNLVTINSMSDIFIVFSLSSILYVIVFFYILLNCRERQIILSTLNRK